MGGAQSLAEGVRACAKVTTARPLIILPPISRFDLHGRQVGATEPAEISAQLGGGWQAHDLTDPFREAQGKRGEDLVVDGTHLKVVDLESGKEWLIVEAGASGPMPAAVGELFERESGVAEALMYDGGHPDAEGSVVMARPILELLEPTLPAAGAAPN